MKIKTQVMRQLNIGIIYLLLDPNNYAVRYVGQTIRNPKERLYSHCGENCQTRKTNWIKSLGEKRPILLVYRIVPCDDINQVEIDTIAHFRKLGCDLTNLTDGGECVTETDRKRISDRQSGEGNVNAVHSNENVMSLYYDYAFTDIMPIQLAKKYGYDLSTVHYILCGDLWPRAYNSLSDETKSRIEEKRKKNSFEKKKLSDQDVTAIYYSYLSGEYSLKALAQDYNRNQNTIRSILKGETYKELYETLDNDIKLAILTRLKSWRLRCGRPRTKVL